MKKLLPLILFSLICGQAWGATFWIRPDGGTCGGTTPQCDGTHDAQQSGAADGGDVGTVPDCACKNLYYVLGWYRNRSSSAGGQAGIMSGGDEVVIANAAYTHGRSPTTLYDCTTASYDCVTRKPPNGSSGNPTVIKGCSLANGCAGTCILDGGCPILSGYGRVEDFIDLRNANYVTVSDIEFTDSSQCAAWNCGSSCSGGQCPTESSGGKISAIHINNDGTDSNIILTDLYLHDLFAQGIYGDVQGITMTDVSIKYMPDSGWDVSEGTSGYATGTITIQGSSPVSTSGSKCDWSWNGCTRNATNTAILTNGCHSQGSGGSADAIEFNDSDPQLTITQCDFSHNTEDGIDTLYINKGVTSGGSVTIKRSRIEGNNGNAVKGPNNLTLEDNVILGNCDFLDNFGFFAPNGSRCRAGAATIVLNWKNDSSVEPMIVNNTLGESGTGLIIQGSGAETCTNGKFIHLRNNILLGGARQLDPTQRIYLWFNDASAICRPTLKMQDNVCTDSNWHLGIECTDTISTDNGRLQTAVSGNVYVSDETTVFTGTIKNESPFTPVNANYMDEFFIKTASAARNIANTGIAGTDDEDFNNFDRDAADGLWDAGALEFGTTGDPGPPTGPVCGNNTYEPTGGEVCDGTDLNSETCITQGFDGGTLSCNANCLSFVTSACTITACGNAVIDAGEQCDTTGPLLGGATCASLGFSADPVDSLLACTASTCQFNTASCVAIACQDGYKEGAEECDDGNATQGDGCSSLCETENANLELFLNYTLTGSPLTRSTHRLTATGLTRAVDTSLKRDLGLGNIGNLSYDFYYSQSSAQDGGSATIAYDAGAEATQDTLSTITFSHTVAAGDNRLLVVSITNEDGGTRTISSVVYGAQSMTKAIGVNGTNNDVDLYYLLAPTVGTANVVVTWSGQVFGLAATADSFTGIAQQAPEVIGSASNASINLVTSSDNSLVISAVVAATSTATVTVPDIQRHNFVNTGSHAQGVSSIVVSQAGATSIGYGVSTGNYAIAAAAFAPANTGGADAAIIGIASIATASYASIPAQDTGDEGFYLLAEGKSSTAQTVFRLKNLNGANTEATCTINNVSPEIWGNINRTSPTLTATLYTDVTRTTQLTCNSGTNPLSVTTDATAHRYLSWGMSKNDSTSGTSISATIGDADITAGQPAVGGSATQSIIITGQNLTVSYP